MDKGELTRQFESSFFATQGLFATTAQIVLMAAENLRPAQRVDSTRGYSYSNSYTGYSETYTQPINTIADQCPYLYGDGVLKARAMRGLFEDGIVYDDAAICAASGYYKMETDMSDEPTFFHFVEAASLLNCC